MFSRCVCIIESLENRNTEGKQRLLVSYTSIVEIAAVNVYGIWSAGLFSFFP